MTLSVILLSLLASCTSSPKIPEEAKNYPEILVRVEGKMFAWQITHAGSDGQLDTADDIKTENLIVAPERHRLKLILSSQDVLHGFFLPSFGVRQTLLPQKIFQREIALVKTGQHRFACSEVCGLGHGKMLGFLEILSDLKYHEWLEKGAVVKTTNLTSFQGHASSRGGFRGAPGKTLSRNR